MAVQPNNPHSCPASSSAAYEVVDLSTATKLDPNGLENTPPADAGGGYYTVSFDATTAYTSTDDMLAYLIELPGVTLADTFRVDVYIWWDTESATKLIGAACVSDSNTSLTSAKGYWLGLSEETADNPDTWLKKLSQAVPIVSSVSADRAVGILTYDHNPSRDKGEGAVYDVDTSGLNPTWKSYPAGDDLTSPTGSGPVYIGLLCSARSSKTGDEGARVKIGHLTTLFPIPL